ncbi:MAG: AMP-binding protein [Chitinispirillaceae bacterium]
MNQFVYADLLKNAVETYSHKSCLHIKRNGMYKSWSFEDFHNDLNRLTHVLRKQGLKRGINAVVIGENSPEWVIAYHGIFLTGACTVPIDPNIPPSEIEEIVQTVEAKVVFCSKVYLNLFRKLRDKYSFLDKVVVLDSGTKEKEVEFDQYLSGGNPQKEAFSNRFKPDDPMVIIFTSGTTGRAKGVVLTQKNYTAVSRHAIPRMNLDSRDTFLAVLPLHHVFGFAACVAGPLCGGMDVVFVPYVKGPLIIEALKDKSVTVLPAVPKMISLFYESVIHNVKKKGPAVSTVFTGMKTLSATLGNTMGDTFRRSLFSSVHKGFGGKLKLIISGGAALGKRYWNGFRQMGFNIVEGYGLTETFGPITLCPHSEPRLGSVGPVLQDNEVKIDDPDSSGVGEILLRGSCVFGGYYKNEQLNQEVFDDDGWFHTGDLGKLDKDGYLYIMGRKKDMIVLDSGKNVYPEELEDHYSASSLIEEIAVFGIKQGEGEIVAAAIVPQKEIRKTYTVSQATDMIYEELVRLGKSLPVYRRIADFVTVYQLLPRTTTRKLKKPLIIKLYNSIKRKSGNRPVAEDQLSVLEMALMDTDEFRGVVEAIVKTSPKVDKSIVNPRSHLETDLGLDSLGRLELLSIIEKRFFMAITDDVFDKMETVADLVSMVKERLSSGEATVTSIEKVMDLKERILAEAPEASSFQRQTSMVHKTFGPSLIRMAGKFLNFSSNGLEQIDISQKPFIFAANHSSVYDAFWILNSLPEEIRKNTFYLGDKEALKYPALPYYLHRPNMLKLDRENDPIEVLKLSLSVLKGRRNLLVFPEGKLNPSPVPAEFKSGVGMIARETESSVVPIRISLGTSGPSAKSNNSNTPVLSFGRPFKISEAIQKGKLSHNCAVEDISSYIRSVITDLR